RHQQVEANLLAKDELLSPRFVWMASKEFDEFTTRADTFLEEAGTSLKSAMGTGRKYGTVPDAMLPFHIVTKMHLGSENAFYAEAAQRKVASYFNLQRDLNQWKGRLRSNWAPHARLSGGHKWDNHTTTGGKLDTYMPNTARGGHAIAIVGYLASGRFIVRNSW